MTSQTVHVVDDDELARNGTARLLVADSVQPFRARPTNHAPAAAGINRCTQLDVTGRIVGE
jgi:hypothetical protein